MADLEAKTLLRPDTYRDSVELMRVAAALEAVPGVQRAAALMATPANRELVAQAGFAASAALATWSTAHPSDLLITVQGSPAGVTAAMELAERLLAVQQVTPSDTPPTDEGPRTLQEAASALPGANLAFISVPGPYAASEALKALKAGLHVFCFSDNVALVDEVRLKQLAAERGLFMMGPDCGTAVIDGVPLGFANVLRRGPVGLVGASGTGLQEVTCLLDRAGVGISQVIGVGSHDLTPEVGGLMLRQALHVLDADPETAVLVAISKPPDPETAATVFATAYTLSKPVVVCFLGAAAGAMLLPSSGAASNDVFMTATLEEAGQVTRRIATGSATPTMPYPTRPGSGTTPASLRRPASAAAHVLGLFSGGTLCAEANIVLGEALGATAGDQCTLLDLGDDRYTVGRPHPMIDPRDRAERIRAASADPTVAIVLLDLVLGHGAHPDPAGALAPAIRAVREARQDLHIVASITGTAGDPQNYDQQVQILRDAGVDLAPSNAAAARRVAELLAGVESGD